MTTPITFLDEIDSTNAEARRRVAAGETGPLWIAAHRQTAGRGRRGRVWEAPAGNLSATLLLTTDKPPAEAAQVSFVAALAVCDFARAYAPGAKVKWPNDVLIDGEKLAGILIESGVGPSGLWLAVGIGINLAAAPSGLERPATSLAAHTARPPTPTEALPLLAATFDDWLSVWNAAGFAAIASAWTARAYGLGLPCVAHLPHETIHGTAEGLEADGSLRLRLEGGAVRAISAGDVFFD